jgi:hypothetical protein
MRRGFSVAGTVRDTQHSRERDGAGISG